MLTFHKIEHSYVDDHGNTQSCYAFVFSSKNCLHNLVHAIQGSSTTDVNGKKCIGLNSDATFNLTHEGYCHYSIGPRTFNYASKRVSHTYRPGSNNNTSFI